MVRVFEDRFIDFVIVVFANEEDVARGAGPLEGKEIVVASLCSAYISIVSLDS